MVVVVRVVMGGGGAAPAITERLCGSTQACEKRWGELVRSAEDKGVVDILEEGDGFSEIRSRTNGHSCLLLSSY